VVSGIGTELSLVGILILINAVFSGSEMALVSLRESQLQRLERESSRGRTLAALARDPNRFLATIQIGITLAGFGASAAAAIALAEPLVDPLSFLGPAAEVAAVVAVTLVLTFVTLVIGELAPKRVAMQRAEPWAMAVARGIDLLASVSRPAIWMLSRTTDLVVRLAGVDPDAARDEVSIEEIRDMITARREFSAEQRTIISGAFEITERNLREILIPRRDVVSVPATMPATQALRLLIDAGHSRAPVTGPRGLDEVVGVAHIRGLSAGEGQAGGHAGEALFLPETLRVSDALRQMRQKRQHLAVVVDEHGANDGIITMEDLVEEIVGEIYDETDRDVRAVIHEADGSMLLPGSFPMHDLPDIGVQIGPSDEGDYTTVAGLIMAELRHIPQQPGEAVVVAGYRFEVVDLLGHAVTRIRLRPEPPTSDAPD
jgi:putative hemolysin